MAASDPEKSARADDMVTKLEEAIAKVEADLDKARAAGDEKKVKELEENLASRRSFLEMAAAPPPTTPEVRRSVPPVGPRAGLPGGPVSAR